MIVIIFISMLSLAIYVLTGILWTKHRWTKFVQEEAAYHDQCLANFLRGDEMNDFRQGLWTEITLADIRLKMFPPQPQNYVRWLLGNIFLWPIILVSQLVSKFSARS